MDENKIKIIYILGYSYSGSTLLGCLLAASRLVFNAGEVKDFYVVQDNGGETCSCGDNTLTCDFWSQIYRERYRLFRNARWVEKISITFKIIFFQKLTCKVTDDLYQDMEFFQTVREKASNRGHEAYFLLDNSKTLWRLNYLLKQPKLDVKTILINREVFGSVSSCIKHGDGFVKGLFWYKVNSYLMRRYLNQSETDYLQINYEELCGDPGHQMARLGNYLNIDYTNYLEEFLEGNFHLPSGNIGTRSKLTRNIPDLSVDQSWEQRLSRAQKTILKLLDPQTYASIFYS